MDYMDGEFVCIITSRSPLAIRFQHLARCYRLHKTAQINLALQIRIRTNTMLCIRMYGWHACMECIPMSCLYRCGVWSTI